MPATLTNNEVQPAITEDAALDILRTGLKSQEGYYAILDIKVALKYLRSQEARDKAAEIIWLSINSQGS